MHPSHSTDRGERAADEGSRRPRRVRRRAADLDSGRAAAHRVRRQARAGHAHDAGRRARAAGARLPAQPAPRRCGRRRRFDHRRLGGRRGGGEDARRHRALRREDRQAGGDHRLRPGHGVRPPDERPGVDRAAAAERAFGPHRPGRALRPAQRHPPPGEHLQVGRLGARLRPLPPAGAADLRRGRGPAQRDRHDRRLDVAARRRAAATRSSTPPAG